MEACDVRVKKCCHDTEIITLPALSSRCQVWADNMTLEAMGGGGEAFRSDQSTTQDDLRTPAGCNPITTATDSDRWVHDSTPPWCKSQAIEVTGGNPLYRFTALVCFCFVHTAGPCPHSANTCLPSPLFLISGEQWYSSLQVISRFSNFQRVVLLLLPIQ